MEHKGGRRNFFLNLVPRSLLSATLQLALSIVAFSIGCEFLPSFYFKLKHSGNPELHSVHHAALFYHPAFPGGGGGKAKNLLT